MSNMSSRLRWTTLASLWRNKLHSNYSLAYPWRKRLYSSDSGTTGGVRIWRAFAFTAVVRNDVTSCLSLSYNLVGVRYDVRSECSEGRRGEEEVDEEILGLP